MKAIRSLTLKREVLAELSTAELRDIVGGVPVSGFTCPIFECEQISDGASCFDCITRTCW